MIEVLQGFPEGVVAIKAKGRVTKSDYEDILIPTVKDALAHHRRIRCYYELGADFAGMEPGALWEDFVLGFEHLFRWERVAVVTDVHWVQTAANAFRFLVPALVQVFGTADASQAKQWITDGIASPQGHEQEQRVVP